MEQGPWNVPQTFSLIELFIKFWGKAHLLYSETQVIQVTKAFAMKQTQPSFARKLLSQQQPFLLAVSQQNAFLAQQLNLVSQYFLKT